MISVCMATYNGAKYIKRQLESILIQLKKDDEVIIYDDCSQDETCSIIKKIADDRIKLYVNNQNLGVNKTFEKALCRAKGEIIFLSDQDDVWEKNKVEYIRNYFFHNQDVDLIQHNAIVVDDKFNIINKSFYDWRGHVGPEAWRNFVRDTHLGCCMALKKKVLQDSMPITSVPYHDRWIGIISALNGYRCKFIPETLGYYVRHDGTVTDPMFNRRNINIIIKDRVTLALEIIKFYLKKYAKYKLTD